jgi:hypothetical protein
MQISSYKINRFCSLASSYCEVEWMWKVRRVGFSWFKFQDRTLHGTCELLQGLEICINTSDLKVFVLQLHCANFFWWWILSVNISECWGCRSWCKRRRKWKKKVCEKIAGSFLRISRRRFQRGEHNTLMTTEGDKNKLQQHQQMMNKLSFRKKRCLHFWALIKALKMNLHWKASILKNLIEWKIDFLENKIIEFSVHNKFKKNSKSDFLRLTYFLRRKTIKYSKTAGAC